MAPVDSTGIWAHVLLSMFGLQVSGKGWGSLVLDRRQDLCAKYSGLT
jgi:hypothetical protein